MVLQIVREGHSILIFCSSRKGCETTAQHISKYLKRFSMDVHDGHSGLMDYSSALEALRKCPSGLDPVLELTLPHGVAYHHAGLTVIQLSSKFCLMSIGDFLTDH